ncbi:hypothetical protein [Tenacibaculum singaporense]|uniref:hypothetical protein n=1 Tax=Tenacibaculum singaporense TaxID=2358479 RepID=UPI000F66CB71|nr:hypothetical protein [Tenacibaculum singaporense]RSC93423.1 hypothetical protein EI424_09400 [Tenacibaculum singaporense]
MKKSILKLGNALNQTEQKQINGGGAVGFCDGEGNCPSGQYCDGIYCYTKDGSGSGTGTGTGTGSNNCTGPWEFCPNGGISCTGC